MGKKICPHCNRLHDRGNQSKKICIRLRRQKQALQRQMPGVHQKSTSLISTMLPSAQIQVQSQSSHHQESISVEKVYFRRPQQFPVKRHPRDDGRCEIYMDQSEIQRQNNPQPQTNFDGDRDLFIIEDEGGFIPKEQPNGMVLRTRIILKNVESECISRNAVRMRFKRQVQNQRDIVVRGKKEKRIQKIKQTRRDCQFRIDKQIATAYKRGDVPQFKKRLPKSLRKLWCPSGLEIGSNLDKLFFHLQTDPWSQIMLGDDLRFQLGKLKNLNSQHIQLALKSHRNEVKTRKQEQIMYFQRNPIDQKERNHFRQSIRKFAEFGLFSVSQKKHLLSSYSAMRQIMYMEYYDRIFNLYCSLQRPQRESQIRVVIKSPYVPIDPIQTQRKIVEKRNAVVQRIVRQYARFGQLCFIWCHHIFSYNTAKLVEMHWRSGFRCFQVNVFPTWSSTSDEKFKRKLQSWKIFLEQNPHLKEFFEEEPQGGNVDKMIEENDDQSWNLFNDFQGEVQSVPSQYGLAQSQPKLQTEPKPQVELKPDAEPMDGLLHLISQIQDQQQNLPIGTPVQQQCQNYQIEPKQTLSAFLKHIPMIQTDAQRFHHNERLLEERILLKGSYPTIPVAVTQKPYNRANVFKRPPFSSRQEISFQKKQIELFLATKGCGISAFARRQNYHERNFQYPKTFGQLSAIRLNQADLQTLDDYEENLLTLPIKFRFVSPKIGAGFDASRKIEKNQFLGFFNGLVVSLEEGDACGNNSYMLEFISGKTASETFVITTLLKTWGIGPMYNGSSKPNMEIAYFWTRRGLQMGLKASVDIKQGDHLVWNYNSQNSLFQTKLIDIQDYINHFCERVRPKGKRQIQLQVAPKLFQDDKSGNEFELNELTPISMIPKQYDPVLREVLEELVQNDEIQNLMIL